VSFTILLEVRALSDGRVADTKVLGVQRDTRQSELACSGAATDLVLALDDHYPATGTRERHSGRETVGAGPDDHCIEICSHGDAFMSR
jgi:hypothetical protein